ncbi:MAG: hypothetical protein IPN76_26355 [Saprospiraceae bacterium]|nr:hypothetical protein [Saprospiraceae bacterium]
MLPASKHLDIVTGVDIHIVNIPTPAGPVPTPIPHPFIGTIFDSGDYNFAAMAMSAASAMGVNLQGAMDVAAAAQGAMSKLPAAQLTEQLNKLKNMGKAKMGIKPPSGPATVKVNGLPRTRTGTKGSNKPKHIPIGGPNFTKGMPSNACEAFMGSMTVLVDGEPFTFAPTPVLSCQCIGMPVPKRKKGASQGGMFLPLSVVLPIPMGPMVFVGGPPVPSMNQLLNKLFDAAFAGALAFLKNSKLMKAVSQAIHNVVGKLTKFLPGPLRNLIHKQICAVTGHPVVIATGVVFTDSVDFEIAGPIPLEWERTWYSSSNNNGTFGYGWHWKYDLALAEDNESGVLLARLEDGRNAIFPPVALGEKEFNPFENLWMSHEESGYVLKDRDGLLYRFEKRTSQGEATMHALKCVENSTGHTISFAYDLEGHIHQITDSAGRIFKIKTNKRGAITEVEAPHPEKKSEWFSIVSYRYDAADNLVEVMDALKQPFHYEYKGHLLIKETNRNGLSFYFEYDGNDEHAWCMRTWGDGGIYDHKLDYHREEKFTIVENSLGHKTTYYWNDQGLVWKTVDHMGHASYQRFTTANQLQSEIDELGQITAYEYDEFGNQTGIIYPDGSSIAMQYDDGLLIAATDQNGGKWAWKYNSFRQLIERTDPNGQKTLYRYENGLLQQMQDPAGGLTTLQYDRHFNLIKMTTPDGASSQWEYDDMGRCTSAIDPKGNEQKRKFNFNGFVRLINEPDGNVRELEYDGEGNVLRAKDNQHDVRFEYAGMNRLKARTEAGTRVEFKYDTEENLLGIINEHGYAYRFELDANGEVVTESGFDGVTRRYSRDEASRVIKVRRAGGIVTQYEYDPMGSVIGVSHSDNSFEKYSYRPDGELTEAINNHIAVKFERDKLGRVTKEMQGGFVVESKYDVLGMRVKLNSSLGADMTFGRNNMGDVEKVTAASGGSDWEASFKRDNLGLELERSLPGGVRSEWKRDRLGRPVEQKTFAAGGKMSRNRQYTWEVNDRLKQITDPQKGTWIFEHDALGNLAAAQYPDGAFEFRVDAVGNLFRTKDQKDRKYGPAGQLLEADGTRYEYDPEGNLIKKTERNGAVWRYEWNAAGMLRRVVRPDGDEVLFTYDALGRRISKSYRDKTTCWVWDGNVPLHEWVEINQQWTAGGGQSKENDEPDGLIKIRRRDTALVTAPANAPPADFGGSPLSEIRNPKSEIVTTWLFEPESFAPLAKLRDGQQFSIVTDHLGTPAAMFNNDGQKVWDMDLSIYGEVRNLDGWREACPFRYPGQYEDVETGLYYNRFRYYDAEGGFYVSQDPIRLIGGYGIYDFVKDPNIWVDELGLHGNCKASAKPNHVYVIYNKKTGQVHKYGISGGKVRKDGKSYRAESQVRKLGPDYESKIIATNVTREKALKIEQGKVNSYSVSKQNSGSASAPVEPPGNVLPKAKM